MHLNLRLLNLRARLSSTRARVAVGSVVVVLVVAAATAFWITRLPGPGVATGPKVPTASDPASLAPEVPSDATPSAGPGYVPNIVGRIQVPSIGVDAPLVTVGQTKDGSMDVPKRSGDVGWYDKGPFPGDAKGDAVVAGHLDWYDTAQAVFFNLKKVKMGDVIITTDKNGKQHTFKVSNITSYPAKARPPQLFITFGLPRLSLITCGGKFDPKTQNYPNRLVVDSVLVS